MSVEENKALYRSFIEEFINEGNLEALEKYVAVDMVEHEALSPELPPGREGVKQQFKAFFGAFPDLKGSLKDVIAEGDKVVGRLALSGTHKGEFTGIAPTGKKMTVETIEIVRISGGKIAEHWGVMDQLDMMQQLGIAPPQEQAKA